MYLAQRTLYLAHITFCPCCCYDRMRVGVLIVHFPIVLPLPLLALLIVIVIQVKRKVLCIVCSTV